MEPHSAQSFSFFFHVYTIRQHVKLQLHFDVLGATEHDGSYETECTNVLLLFLLFSLSLSVKGTGGMLAHSPPVAAATFPVITWLQWTLSRLKSKSVCVCVCLLL